MPPRPSSIALLILLTGWLLIARGADETSPCQLTGTTADGVVVTLSGSGRIQRQSDFLPAETGSVLCSGDSLSLSSQSRAVVRYRQDTLINLGGGSTLTLPAHPDDESPLLRLVRGILYLLVRDPHGLALDTPFYRAGVEGTEFTSSTGTEAYTWVMEGRVRLSNKQGERLLTQGKAGRVDHIGQAPQPLTLSPENAVQWAIDYPALLDDELRPLSTADDHPAFVRAWQAYLRGDLPEAIEQLQDVPPELRDAAFHSMLAALDIAAGQPDDADNQLRLALQLAPTHPHANALKALMLIRENRLDAARQQLHDAPGDSTAVLLAKSYLQQALHHIDAAHALAQQATSVASNSPLAYARLSETALMLGDNASALAAAQTALDLAGEQTVIAAYAQTTLGFALLARAATADAQQAFTAALSTQPLHARAWLGSGLADINLGNVEKGRQSLETAVVLDPLRALYRSYLGRAYLQENRPALAQTQFELARQFDPLSPLPWVFEANASLQDNAPARAVQQLRQAESRLHHRAVYRTPELLALDAGLEQATLSTAYAALGFDQLAALSADNGISRAPASPASHAEKVAALRRQDDQNNALRREQWQQQLRSSLSPLSQRAALSSAPVPLEHSLGPEHSGYGEYRQLFNTQGSQGNLNALAGSQNTLAESLEAGHWRGSSALTAQQVHYQSDGYRDNQSLDFDSLAISARHRLREGDQLFLQLSGEDWRSGDLTSRIDDRTDPDFQQSVRQTRLDLALHHRRDAHRDWLFNVSLLRNEENFSDGAEAITLKSDGDTHAGRVELQHIRSEDRRQWILGSQAQRQRGDLRVDVISNSSGAVSSLPQSRYQDSDLLSAYAYLDTPLAPHLKATLGISAQRFENQRDTVSGISPKLGLIWDVTPTTRIRAAAFESLQNTLLINDGLEPTAIAGFSQFSDLHNGAMIRQLGLGLDTQLAPRLFAGLESRQQTITPFDDDNPDRPKTRRLLAYLYWLPNDRLSLSAAWRLDHFERQNAPLEEPCSLDTRSLPLQLTYFPNSRLSARFTVTPVQQDVGLGSAGLFAESCSGNTTDTRSRFTTLDASLSYRLPQDRGWLTLGGQNLSDQTIHYQDNSFQYSLAAGSPKKVFSTQPYAPERTIFLRYKVDF